MPQNKQSIWMETNRHECGEQQMPRYNYCRMPGMFAFQPTRQSFIHETPNNLLLFLQEANL